MSNKERAKQIIDSLPDYKVTKILYLLQGIQFDDEIEDDIFCENLTEYYLNNRENDEKIPFENALKEAGFTIYDIQD